MNGELAEDFRILQRFEHRAFELGGEVDLTFDAVGKTNPDEIARDVTGFDESVVHYDGMKKAGGWPRPFRVAAQAIAAGRSVPPGTRPCRACRHGRGRTG